MEDPSPVMNGAVQVALPPMSSRIFPVDPTAAETEAGLVVKFSSIDSPNRRYAGIHETLFLSEDNFHTSVLQEMMGTSGNYMRLRHSQVNTNYSLMHQKREWFDGNLRFTLGALFTNQSTTGMGANVANTHWGALTTERDYYFGNVVRAGPAHVSIGRTSSTLVVEDDYWLLLPSLFNTFGASGSPMPSVTRLLAASAYIPVETKKLMLRHGALANAMLYCYKAALPYQVDYGHSARHRVAYIGGGIVWNSHLAIPPEHAADHYIDIFEHYDPFLHFDRMVKLFRGMTLAPPIAIFGDIVVLEDEDTSGITPPDPELKTAKWVFQGAQQTVRVRVCTAACYDIQGLPVDVRFEIITGNRRTTIKDEGGGKFLITVPPDASLPEHRTTILMIANNGVYDSNPAALSIRRADSASIISQPLSFPRGLRDMKVLAGTTRILDLFSASAAATPSTIDYLLWDGTGARLDGSQVVLAPAASAEPSKETVVAVADDTVTGNAVAGSRMRYEVVQTLADLKADTVAGLAPLSVRFDGSESAAVNGEALSLRWDFDDGTSSILPSPQKTFTSPGLYHVTLTAAGASGADMTTRTIHVYPTTGGAGAWPLRLNNGWSGTTVDPAVWNSTGAQVTGGNLVLRKSASLSSITSVQDLTLPCYLEMDFIYGRDDVGIWIFGQKFGRSTVTIPGRSTQQRYDFSFHRQPVQTSVPPVFLAGFPDVSGSYSRGLRVFAENDPANPGKMRLSGRIITPYGERAFHFENLDILDSKLRMDRPTINSENLTVHRLQIWSPGGAAAVAEPSLALFGKDGTLISDTFGIPIIHPVGDDRFFGVAQSPGAQISRTFRLINRGNAALNLSGIPTISFVSSNAKFSLFQAPGQTVLQPGEATEFTVRFVDNGGGYKSTFCQIFSSDPRKPNLKVPVSAFGFIAPALELRGNGLIIPSGRSETHRADRTLFPATEDGQIREHTFTLYNRGTGALTLGAASLSGGGAGNFSITKQPRAVPGPLGSTSFTVRYSPSDEGTHDALVTISSSTGAISFPLRGIATAAVPRTLGVSFKAVPIARGDNAPTSSKGTDFGGCALGDNIARVFTLSALSGNVRISHAAITGPGARNFFIQRDPPGLVVPGVTGTMRVLYQASAVQEDIATLTIFSDDSQHPEFAFNLRGLGITGGALPVVQGYEAWRAQISWNGADSSALGDASRDGVSNFLKFAFGQSPLESAPSPVGYIFSEQGRNSMIQITYPKAREEIIYTVEVSTSLASGSWTTAGVIQDTTTPVGETATATVIYGPIKTQPIFLRVSVRAR